MSRATELADKFAMSKFASSADREAAMLDELRRLDRVNAELVEALSLALPFMEAEAVISGYGFYRSANPNNFSPDPESCSPEEIANHRLACKAYDEGSYRDDYGDGWVSPNLHITKAPWGIGSYSDEFPELAERCKFARAALTSATKETK